MNYRKKAGFWLIFWLVSVLFYVPVQAAFLTTDCTDTATTGVPEIECRALEALWDSTNGSGWSNSGSWDTNIAIRDWNFVFATPSGNNVAGLHLHQNNLTGTIPPELGNLSELQDLRLYSNQLSGTIPTELGNLTKLGILAVYSNQLTGVIPASLGNLGMLISLNLYNNQLDGSIPSSLGNLNNLTQLQLQSNALTGAIPKELGSLSNLQFLSLDGNSLTGSIPIEFQNLNKLFNLALNSNQLSGDIPDLNGNAVLQRLYITENHFVFEDFEPEHLAYITKLRTYQFNPQDHYVDSARTINFIAGQTMNIIPELNENPSGNDQYQWSRNGVPIPAPAGTQRIYTKTATPGDAGNYTYRVQNSVVLPMQLASHFGNAAIVVTVDAISQPDYASVPTPATGVQLSVVQNDTNPRQDIFISNIGEPGSILSGQCAETSDPDNAFTLIGTLPWDTAEGDPVPMLVQIMCDSSAAVGIHTGDMQCTHNGDGTTESSPASYALACEITTAAVSAYSVGGSISGLTGSVTLQNNGADDLLRNVNGNFTFVTELADGDSYSVTVSTQPTGQTCSLSNEAGLIAGANITNVMVTCVDDNIPPPVTGPAIPIPTMSITGLGILTMLMGLIGMLWWRPRFAR